MASLLGQYPSLHKVGKTTNHFSTNIISLVFVIGGNLVNLVGVVPLFVW